MRHDVAEAQSAMSYMPQLHQMWCVPPCSLETMLSITQALCTYTYSITHTPSAVYQWLSTIPSLLNLLYRYRQRSPSFVIKSPQLTCSKCYTSWYRYETSKVSSEGMELALCLFCWKPFCVVAVIIGLTCFSRIPKIAFCLLVFFLFFFLPFS